MRANLVTLGLLAVALVWMGVRAPEIAWTPVHLVGAAIAATALVLLVTARLQLGSSFSVAAKAKALVTTGVYARVRNPIYVFGGVFVAGIAMVMGSWRLFALDMALMPVQWWRARREERVLAEAFGEEYARYKAGTWF